jgi:hypothetical protein
MLGQGQGVLTATLSLHPSVSPKICPFATPECKALCLVDSGYGEICPTVNEGRKRRTIMFLENRQTFVEQLRKEISNFAKLAAKKGMLPAVRLNCMSDILWERYLDLGAFPTVQFYDYTKIPIRHRQRTSNYHLTFSYSGRNMAECLDALAQGVNVAVVFAKYLPETWNGYKVIDGVKHDLRFTDPRGVIVGLLPKGHKAKQAAKEGSIFIIAQD